MAFAVDDIATYLAGAGIGLTLGTNLFKWDLVPTPDAQVALIPYAGMEPEATFGRAGVRWEHIRIQVISRGIKDGDRAAFTMADTVYTKLALIMATTLSGTFYHKVWPLSPPTQFGADTNGRPMIAFNVGVERDLGQ